MSSNILYFPNENPYELDQWNRCQEAAKKIAVEWCEESETVEEYPLALAMACGFALDYLRQNHIDLYEDYYSVLDTVINGKVLRTKP